ncbi:uncharacterized protein MYCGRDRAFT_96838 [Zymoseptoria tritici IPO323]|uniref:Secreted protein n=1 Tax=Zymoseptoria tritici (strain CBS 115943 / IPO323) TaxID=336722 RepID=F9XMA0_ZYMTI|nr:uncharacterized protein MYCGRDRAFT_96838 [Zymoseptoria tritici IPO323]EGP83448.1 hypothetical protein MYCGRDRAFT_96838 [Zymoseptoria tritici IPO323]
MKLSLITVATAALTVYHAQASHWKHFNILFNRYLSDDCHEGRSMERGSGLKIHEGECSTWGHSETFNAFAYAWLQHTDWEEMPADKTCAVLIYEEDHCHGRLLFVNDALIIWPGRSVKLARREKGKSSVWADEVRWKNPELIPTRTRLVPIVVPIATNAQ